MPTSASGRSAIAGERGIAVAGPVTGSVFVTGDNVSVELKVGPESGALLERMALLQKPRIRKRRSAAPPPRFPNHLDRVAEASLVVSALQTEPVNVHGEAGIGKTYVLCDVANRPREELARGDAVYLFARGKSKDDVLQAIFDELYSSTPPTRPSSAQVIDLLRGRKPLLLLDSLELERDEAQALVLSLPTCAVVAASRSRVLWDGRALPLAGLDQNDANALIEHELGRALEPKEAAAAEWLWQTLEGHPLRLRQTVGAVKELGRSLSVSRLSDVRPDDGLLDEAVRSLSRNERLALAVLVLLDGVDIGAERLAQLVDEPDVTATLEKLERLGLAESHSPRYSATGVVEADSALVSDVLPDARRRLVDWLLGWLRTDPRLQDVSRELPALITAVRLAHGSGRLRETVELGRAIDAALALSRRWDAWHEVLRSVLEAARTVGDRHGEAWALHQLGTRAACLGDTPGAEATLREALEIRRQLGDDEGAGVTEHNLEVGLRPPPLLARIWNRWLFTVPLSVILGGILAALMLSGGGAAAAIVLSKGGDGGVPTTEPHETARLAITFRGDGSGSVSIDPGGRVCRQDCESRLDTGTHVELRPAGAAGSRFTGWRGCSDAAGRVCELTLTEDVTLAAVFVRRKRATRELQVSVVNGRVTSEPTGIDCPSACTRLFPLGIKVTLKATEQAPFALESWRGCSRERGAECVVVMDQDRQVRAVFRRTEEPTHTIKVRVLGPDEKTIGGTVTNDVGGITCPGECQGIFSQGTTVTLKATASSGFAFDSWDGCPESEATVCRVTMDADHVVTAVFRAEDVPEQPTLTPSAHHFGSVEILISSEPFSFTLTAGSDALRPQAQLSATKDFKLVNTCDTTLAAKATCTLDVTFTPVAEGGLSATLTVTAGGATLTASLTGTGTVLPPTLEPPAHDFGTIDVGETGRPFSFVLTAGSESLDVNASVGDTKDFELDGNCTTSLPRHQTCTLEVTFSPVAKGERRATLRVRPVGIPSLTASLTGIGKSLPPTLSPRSHDFGSVEIFTSSDPFSFTLRAGSEALRPQAQLSATKDFKLAKTCNTKLAAKETCALDVIFTPVAEGTRSATLTVNAGGSTLTSSLTGIGKILPPTLTPPSHDFGTVDVGKGGKSYSFTLTAGSEPLGFTAALVGTKDFSLRESCPVTLDRHERCMLDVTFTPIAEGLRGATLRVKPPFGRRLISTVTGTGTLLPPVLVPTKLDFGTIYLKSASKPRTITVTAGSLAIGPLAPTTSSKEFSVSRNGCGGTVAPFTSCTFDVVFAPTVFRDRRATLSVAAGGTSLSASLQGYGWARATWFTDRKALSLSVFRAGESTTGTVKVAVSRLSAAPLLYRDVLVSGSPYFSAKSNCGSIVPVGSSCTVTVTFAPTGPLNDTNNRATLTIRSRNGGTRTVSLYGYYAPE